MGLKRAIKKILPTEAEADIKPLNPTDSSIRFRWKKREVRVPPRKMPSEYQNTAARRSLKRLRA